MLKGDTIIETFVKDLIPKYLLNNCIRKQELRMEMDFYQNLDRIISKRFK